MPLNPANDHGASRSVSEYEIIIENGIRIHIFDIMRLKPRHYCVFFAIIAMTAGCGNSNPKNRTGNTGSGANNKQANVIIYLIDAVRPDHLSLYGYERDTSPQINKFASDSIVFTGARAQCSWTRPSIGVLFTGRYPTSHGAIDREDSLDPLLPTLAGMLKKAGYETAAFSANPNIFPEYGFRKGFDNFFKIEAKSHYATADRIIESVFAYLDKRSFRKPLFMYIHAMDAHFPYIPPAAYMTKFRSSPVPENTPDKSEPVVSLINRYDGGIAFDDYCFGELVKRLKKDGLYENSIIMALSDHGEEFKDHKGLYHGWTLFEEQVRIPLIIKLPHNRGAGRKERRTVGIIDILPTIRELLMIDDTTRVEGKSFSSVLAGDKRSRFNHIHFAEECLDGHILRSWKDGHFKLIEEKAPEKKVFLFDLKNDPLEVKNIAESQTNKVSKLLTDMNRFSALLAQGFHMEFVNGEPPLEQHSIRGFIKIAGGRFIDASAAETEADDSVVFDKSGKAIHFRFNLRNKPNPVRINPAVLHDAERIDFKVSSSGARLQLQLETEGNAVPAKNILLGNGKTAGKSKNMPLEFGVTDPDLVMQPGAIPLSPSKNGGFSCRLYRIPEVATHKVRIDETQKRRLRELGYIR